MAGKFSAVIRWDAAPEGDRLVAGYAISIRTKGGGQWFVVGFVHSSSSLIEFNVTGLSPSTAYVVRASVVPRDPGENDLGHGPALIFETLALGKYFALSTGDHCMPLEVVPVVHQKTTLNVDLMV